MKKTHYGQLDLTKLGQIVRKQPNLVKKVNFKDGEHQLINVKLLDKEGADEYGRTHSIVVECKKDDQINGLSYFILDMKPETDSGSQAPQEATEEDFGDLPF